ncbi:tyrosine-type recombinase/integrase [Vibrio parahaemolyticus]|uniref:site-specific integrase n=2 Tax=Vibrio TaxID=662 RepID=UPI001C5FB283|nr:site-specific integrase [Vibrio parahaemolyticus]
MNNRIRREVTTSVHAKCRIRKPILAVNDDEEIITTYSLSSRGTLIKEMTLLYISTFDEKGRLISYKPIDMANDFILSKHTVDKKLESRQISQALALYFTFILTQQEEWDRAFEEGEIDPDWDDPRPQWDVFPFDKANRLTYQFREQLKCQVLEEEVLARTTAKAYMRAIVNFYKYWMLKGKVFTGKPFEVKDEKIIFAAGATSIKPYIHKLIRSTDLTLNFPKSTRTNGFALGSVRRDLRPFTNSEWKRLQDIILKTRRVVRYGDYSKTYSLGIEFSYHFMTCRTTGLRAKEAASLHSEQIVNPNMEINTEGVEVYSPPILKLGVGDRYGSLTKTKEYGNKSRVTIIPAWIMRVLYEYTQSARYKRRLAKFKEWCNEKSVQGQSDIFKGDDAVDPSKNYLFISQTGKPMMLDVAEFSKRWIDVRNTANCLKVNDEKIVGSLHNLRSTFAVDVFRHLLKNKTSDQALHTVQGLLGHEELDTTLKYLKIAQDLPSGDEIYEDVLDYIGAFNDVELD